MIDPAISLGSLVSIFVTLATGLGFVWAIKSSVKVLETRMTYQDAAIDGVQEDVKTLNKVVTDLAVQDRRMTTLEAVQAQHGKRLDDSIARVDRLCDAKVMS